MLTKKLAEENVLCSDLIKLMVMYSRDIEQVFRSKQGSTSKRELV